MMSRERCKYKTMKSICEMKEIMCSVPGYVSELVPYKHVMQNTVNASERVIVRDRFRNEKNSQP